MSLFAERLLVDREEEHVPDPTRYDARRQLSLAADGSPFVEFCGSADLVTLTEASGEAADEDDDRRRALASSVTLTFTDAEAPDEHPQPEPPPADQRGPAWMTTLTKAEGEGADAPLLMTQTRQAPGEAPGDESGLWAVTKSAAPGERPED